MSKPYFARLAPYIQQYIYKRKWDRMSEIQLAAADILWDTPNHVLLCSGTSSGKTEAALFPALTQLYREPSNSIGILYISPLKALINDQYERLKDLLQDNLPVWHWHGDVSAHRKNQLIRNPSGILQITPESLEGLLMNRPSFIKKLFGELRFVVIDEVHAFMGTDRGVQVQCQMERLQRLGGCNPRRIGLSATLNDYNTAKEWLAAENSVPVEVVTVAGTRKLRLKVEHFWMPDDNGFPVSSSEHQDYYDFIYNCTHHKKAIIFTNSRTDAEMTTLELRKVAESRKQPDIFYVHHGSLSKMMREEAEASLRLGSGPAVTAATLTLELGLDLGDLDRVVQLGAPYSASSFVQRLGRSGRRQNKYSEMVFVCPEVDYEEKSLPDHIPWMLLRSIAVIELYIRDRWVEPISLRSLPVGVLYQQTMSILKSHLELTPRALAEAVLSLPAFKNVEPEQFRQLLKHLIATDHIQMTEERSLIIGLAGERIANHYRFYGVFQEDEVFSVQYGNVVLGTVMEIPSIRFVFVLAGKKWAVSDINYSLKVVYVQPAEGGADTLWSGKGGDVHHAVLSKMREILSSNEKYTYLSSRAGNRLNQARRDAQAQGMHQHYLIQAHEGGHYLIPWLGSRAFRTLERILKFQTSKDVRVTSVKTVEPYYFYIKGSIKPNELWELLQGFNSSQDLHKLIHEERESLYLGKYDEYLPLDLVQAAYFSDGIDLRAVESFLNP